MTICSEKSILLIAPAYSYRAIEYLHVAQHLQIPLVWASDGPANLSDTTYHGFRVDFKDHQEAVRQIVDQVDNDNIGLVIAPDEKFVELAANIAAELKLTHNRPEAIQNATNKHLSRQVLQKYGLPVPTFFLIDLSLSIDAFSSEVEFPCVIKPVNMSASRGVIRIDSIRQLADAIERIKRLLQQEFGEQTEQTALIEQYVAGTEHAYEGYLEDGLLQTICVFDKPDPLEGPYFEETYYITPSRLDRLTQRAIADEIQKACSALGLTTGPVHAEVRVDNELIWILEVAPRSIGGDCGHLFSLATNLSLEEYIVRKQLGRTTHPIQFTDAAGVLMIPVEENGILRRVEGVTDALNVEDISEIRLDVREGERMTKWPEGGKYPGYIFSKAASPELAEKALRCAYDCLNFVCFPQLPVTVQTDS